MSIITGVIAGGRQKKIPNLVGWWKLNDGIGTTVADSSGNGLTGNFTDGPYGPGYGPLWSNTDGVDCLFFETVGYPYVAGYVDMGNKSILDLEVATFSLWIFVNYGRAYIISKNNQDYTNNGYTIWLNETGGGPDINISIGGSNYAFGYGTFQVPVYGQWNHIGVTWDTNVVTAYSNGITVNTVTQVSNNTSSAYNFQLGTEDQGTSGGNGDNSVSNIRVYNIVKTTSQVRSIMFSECAEMAGVMPTPVGYWKVNEGSGTTLIDYSGNGYNLAITSPSWTNGPTGNPGTALYYDGTGGTYATILNALCPALAITTGSVCCWVNVGDTVRRMIISKDDFSTDIGGYNFQIFPDNGEYGYLELADFSGAQIIGSSHFPDTTYVSDVPIVNTWYFTSVTWDGTTIFFYVNGLICSTAAQTHTPVSNVYDFTLGKDSGGGGYYMSGSIGSCRIYDTVLTPAQMMNLYNTGG